MSKSFYNDWIPIALQIVPTQWVLDKSNIVMTICWAGYVIVDHPK